MGSRRFTPIRVGLPIAITTLFAVTGLTALAGCAGSSGSRAAPRRTVAAPSAPSAPSPAIVAHYATVAGHGVQLHVRSLGGGSAPQVVLLVHGGPGLDLESLDSLNPLAGPAAGGRVRPARAGRSSRPADGDFSLDAQLADLDAVRRWTGAGQVDLVGASWGGLIAAAYAAQMPTHVRLLILLDPAPLDLNEFLAGQRRFGDRQVQLQRAGFVPDPLPSDRNDSCVPMLQALMPVYLGDPREKPPPNAITTCTASTSHATYVALLARGRLDDVAAGLAHFSGPALVLDGQRDPFGRQWGDRARQLLIAARTERISVPAPATCPTPNARTLCCPRWPASCPDPGQRANWCYDHLLHTLMDGVEPDERQASLDELAGVPGDRPARRPAAWRHRDGVRHLGMAPPYRLPGGGQGIAHGHIRKAIGHHSCAPRSATSAVCTSSLSTPAAVAESAADPAHYAVRVGQRPFPCRCCTHAAAVQQNYPERRTRGGTPRRCAG